MNRAILKLASELAARGQSFAIATVVRREPPFSARVGDTGLIEANGEFHGWLGGSCTHDLVIREARTAIEDGEPRLLAMWPDAGADQRPGLTVLPMSCHSGGSVEIYVEPMMPQPRLVIFGDSPFTRALMEIGLTLGLAVDLVDAELEPAEVPGADRVIHSLEAPELREATRTGARIVAVVATHGRDDEDALAAALRMTPDHLSLVSSRKRFAVLRDSMLSRGFEAEELDRIDTPAGLDIGAVTPAEIALSVLASVVQAVRRPEAAEPAAPVSAAENAALASADAAARDPICGMTVDPATTPHTAEQDGRSYYFCCGSCRARFESDPDRWLRAGEPEIAR